MSEDDWLAERFESHRDHLRAVAYRMLGSQAEADDAVQEAWLRLTRSDTTEIANLGGWLTTVVGRVSLDMLRSRAARREDAEGDHAAVAGADPDPEGEAIVADTVGSATLVVLDTLSPSERLAFVLHDVFAVRFDEIGSILGRSSNAAKQLASRARRKVQASGSVPSSDPNRQRQVLDAFLAASRDGDFDTLLALLHPGVVLEADAAAVAMGSPQAITGARDVAGTFAGRALAAQVAIVDGAAGLVWMVGGRPRVVWDFTVEDGRVVHVDMLASPDSLELVELQVVGEPG